MASKKKASQETALVLRTCSADLTSHGGFQWPDKIGAVVEAPDWKKDNKCGHPEPEISTGQTTPQYSQLPAPGQERNPCQTLASSQRCSLSCF
ncbi:TPA: hypothetical protein ACPH2G_004574 [Pseudomonas aeruginosa]